MLASGCPDSLLYPLADGQICASVLYDGNVCSDPSSSLASHSPSCLPPLPRGSQLALITSGSSCSRLRGTQSALPWAGICGLFTIYPCHVSTANFIGPKMHSRVFGTEAGIHFVPDNSQSFLPSFPSASFNQPSRSLLSVHTTCCGHMEGSGEAGHEVPGHISLWAWRQLWVQRAHCLLMCSHDALHTL